MSTKSSKNELQEFCTMNKWNYPIYELLSTSPEFTVRVRIKRDDGSEITTEASDVKKKGAEKEAARLALLKLCSLTTELTSNSVMDTAIEDTEITPVACLDGIEIPNTNSPNSCSLLGSQKNYRSRLHEYCQHHGLKIKFSSGETFETPDAPRFSVMLSVENRNVSGGGSSKKDANEDAARKMWLILEQDNSYPSNNSNIPPPKIIQDHPFTMGIQHSFNNEIMIDVNDPQSEADLLEQYQLVPPKLNTAQFIPSTQSVNNYIHTDQVAELEELLKVNNTGLNILYTLIPTEGLLTESVYLFIHLIRENDLFPTYTGHGFGATEMDAKNAAVRNLMHLLPKNFTKVNAIL